MSAAPGQTGKLIVASGRLKVEQRLMAQALTPWRGGRVVYGSGLENQRVFTGTVGSNPTLSVFQIVTTASKPRR